MNTQKMNHNNDLAYYLRLMEQFTESVLCCEFNTIEDAIYEINIIHDDYMIANGHIVANSDIFMNAIEQGYCAMDLIFPDWHNNVEWY